MHLDSNRQAPAACFFRAAAENDPWKTIVGAAATIVLGMGVAASAPQIVAFELPSVRIIAAAQLETLRTRFLEPALTAFTVAVPGVDRALASAFERSVTPVAYGEAPAVAAPATLREGSFVESVRFDGASPGSLDAEAARSAAVDGDANAESEVRSAPALEMARASAARFGVGAPITPARVPALALSYNAFVMAPVAVGTAAAAGSSAVGAGGAGGSGSLDGVKLPGGTVAAPSNPSHSRGEIPGQRRPGP